MARKKKEIVEEEIKEETPVVEAPVEAPADEPVEEAGVEETPAETPEAEPMKTEVIDFDNEVKPEAGFARGAQALQRVLFAKKGKR